MSTYSLKIKVPQVIDKIVSAPVLLGRKIWYGYTFRRIKLIGGKYALVSPEDFHEISQYIWFAKKTPRSYTAVRFEAKGRILVPVHMHRQIMGLELATGNSNNCKSKISNRKLIVDHKNRDGIDNRRPNLRLATESQNCMNRCGQRGTSSKYKGVTWNRARRLWCAAIQVGGKAVYLGGFEDEEEAARAYDAAARRYQGEFAYQNFPGEEKQKGLKFVLSAAFRVLSAAFCPASPKATPRQAIFD